MAMYRNVLLAGFGLWVVGTAAFRLGPAGMVQAPDGWRTVVSYAVNALAALIVSRLLFRWIGVPAESRPAAMTLFILPTLLLDPFATAFFPYVFPNLRAAAAPTFGGLMLISAAGAVI